MTWLELRRERDPSTYRPESYFFSPGFERPKYGTELVRQVMLNDAGRRMETRRKRRK